MRASSWRQSLSFSPAADLEWTESSSDPAPMRVHEDVALIQLIERDGKEVDHMS